MTKPAPSLEPLPEVLRTAMRAGGPEAAARLAKAFGGKRIYIPKEAGDNHPLVVAGGRAAADAIMSAFGGYTIQFPKGEYDARRLAVVASLKRGDGPNGAAAASGLSYRQAHRIKLALVAGGVEVAATRKKTPRARDPKQIDIEELLKRK